MRSCLPAIAEFPSEGLLGQAMCGIPAFLPAFPLSRVPFFLLSLLPFLCPSCLRLGHHQTKMPSTRTKGLVPAQRGTHKIGHPSTHLHMFSLPSGSRSRHGSWQLWEAGRPTSKAAAARKIEKSALTPCRWHWSQSTTHSS